MPLGCPGCPYNSNPKKVGSKGPVDSPFVIVGESPGAQELVKGVPFIGPSGKMLDEVLERNGFKALGIEPYVTNAMQCCPGSQKSQEGTIAAAISCHNRLVEEIAAHPRKLILSLGSAAICSLRNNYNLKITQIRGQVFQSELAEQGIVAALHPAYIMRNGSAFSRWEHDLRLAIQLLRDEPIPEWTDPTWSEIDTRQELEDLCELVEAEVGPGDWITGDFETDSLDSLSGRILELGLTWGNNDHVYEITEECFYGNIDLMRRLMERKGPLWNWHNGKFDIRWCWRVGIQARVDDDTMLLSYSLNENGGQHDLDQVAYTWLKAPDHKNVLKPYLPNKKTSYRVIPIPVRRDYAAKDVKKTHELVKVLKPIVMADKHLRKSYSNLLIPGSEFCCHVEEYGVLIDLAQVEKNKELYATELAALDAKLDEYAAQHGMKGMNFGSWQQLQQLLYNRMRLGPVGSSTKEDFLIKFQRQTGHPIFDTLMKRREVAKEAGTYVNNMDKHIHPDGRVHMTYKLHGTTTGRLAGAEPNLLNQPRKKAIRDQYIAGEGKIFVEVDLNQAELRSLAIMSGDPILVQIYTENVTSIHDVTTAKFFGSKKDMSELEEVRIAACKQLQLPLDSEPSLVYKEAKMRGKAVNFGIVYGREAFGLAAEFNIPVNEAQRWIDAWFEAYSGAAKFIKWCRRAPMDQKTLVTVFGRKKRWGCVSHENLNALQNEAANFPHQSTASDVMLTTAIEVRPVLKERWDANIWLELYDAIYYEMDDNPQKVAESVKYVQQVIPRVAKDAGLIRVPFIGDAKIGYAWGSMDEFDPDSVLKAGDCSS